MRSSFAAVIAAGLMMAGCQQSVCTPPGCGPEPSPTPTPTPPPSEECNGLDDDGDAGIDEGFPDLDADGIADCVDDACAPSSLEPGPVEVLGTCHVADFDCYHRWDVEVEWQWNGHWADSEVASNAVSVGMVVDTDGDGVPGVSDVPAVVAAAAVLSGTGAGGSFAIALDGLTGYELSWPPQIFDPPVSMWWCSALDVDDDGWSEAIVRRGSSSELVLTAVQPTAGELWSASLEGGNLGLLEVAALDECDGLCLVANDQLVKAATGELVRTLGLSETSPDLKHNPTPIDLDGDGLSEFAAGPLVFDSSGDLLWEAQRAAWYSQWWVPVEYDGDDGPELVLVGEGWFDIYDGDGTLLRQNDAGNPYPFPPCAADVNGDGEVELVWAAKPSVGSTASDLGAWKLDGTPLWSIPVVDGGWSGCSAFDFDGDGALEVLHADQEDFYILDGATGQVLYQEPAHESQTISEYPLVADIDLDGSAEIVLVHSQGWESGPNWQGVTVLGHVDSLWPGARPTWPLNNLRDYRFDDLGNFIGEPATLAGETNLLRARAPILRDHPDLRVRVAGSCLSGCSEVSMMNVVVEVTNNGPAATESEVSLELFAGEDPTPLQTVTVPPLGGGTASEPIVFELPALSVTGPLRFLVDGGCGDGAVVECDEGNNELIWTPPDLCP